MAQSRIDQSSVRSFSTGVPVRATRAPEAMERRPRAVVEREFLTCWASSATTSPQVTSPSSLGRSLVVVSTRIVP